MEKTVPKRIAKIVPRREMKLIIIFDIILIGVFRMPRVSPTKKASMFTEQAKRREEKRMAIKNPDCFCHFIRYFIHLSRYGAEFAYCMA